ncbi:MAG: glycine--tRNA ligase [Candidatus Anstonellales archaeon]
MKHQKLYERLMEIALQRSFLIPSFEIYGSISGFYDYGPVGCLMKKKIEDYFRKFFIKSEGFFEIETSTVLPSVVLEASGHAKNFVDPLIRCKACSSEFKADEFLDQKKLEASGWNSPEELLPLLKKEGIACPACGGEFESKGWFNLMFKTNIGPVEGNTGYFRPETAQGIFLDFSRIFRNHGTKLPICVGQIGKSFRNEISPRKGILRLREFTQMELEYFFDPRSPTIEKFSQVETEQIRIMVAGSDRIQKMSAAEAVRKGIIPNEIMAYFMVRQTQFYTSLGIPYEKFYFKKMGKKDTPHYSAGNFDLEIETSFGVIETIGNAYRTDFDLSSHSSKSGVDLRVYVNHNNPNEAKEGKENERKIIPHVVEPSMGLDRLFWCILEHTFREKGNKKDWAWFDFPPVIAPYSCAVYPLMRRDGLSEKALDLLGNLRAEGLDVIYTESGSIGRRYARADEIGIPYCLTIDYDTLKDDTVTIRYRNDGKQERIKVGEVYSTIIRNIKEGRVTL